MPTYGTIFPTHFSVGGCEKFGGHGNCGHWSWRATTTRPKIVLDLAFDAQFNGQPVYGNLPDIGRKLTTWSNFSSYSFNIIDCLAASPAQRHPEMFCGLHRTFQCTHSILEISSLIWMKSSTGLGFKTLKRIDWLPLQRDKRDMSEKLEVGPIYDEKQFQTGDM